MVPEKQRLKIGVLRQRAPKPPGEDHRVSKCAGGALGKGLRGSYMTAIPGMRYWEEGMPAARCDCKDQHRGPPPKS